MLVPKEEEEHEVKMVSLGLAVGRKVKKEKPVLSVRAMLLLLKYTDLVSRSLLYGRQGNLYHHLYMEFTFFQAHATKGRMNGNA